MTAQLQICFLSEGTCAGEWNGSGVALRNSHPSACWDQQTGAVIGAKLALGELGPCHSRYLIPTQATYLGGVFREHSPPAVLCC